MSEERLQKILARAGVASRRKAEELIRDGRVTINGRVAEIGDKADLVRDSVKMDAHRIHAPAVHRYLLLNKPRGVMSTVSDPAGRPTVIDLVPPAMRRALAPVGRLDFHTEGLMLLTDDGDLAQQVAHPSHGCWKTYEVKVRGRPEEEQINRLRAGIVLEGRRTAPCHIAVLRRRPPTGPRRGAAADGDTSSWWSVELGEGRTRQIREMFQRIGHPVQKLRRVAIGPVSDPAMPVGMLRELTDREVAALRKAGPPPPRKAAAGGAARRSAPAPGFAPSVSRGSGDKPAAPGKAGRPAAKPAAARRTAPPAAAGAEPEAPRRASAPAARPARGDRRPIRAAAGATRGKERSGPADGDFPRDERRPSRAGSGAARGARAPSRAGDRGAARVKRLPSRAAGGATRGKGGPSRSTGDSAGGERRPGRPEGGIARGTRAPSRAGGGAGAARGVRAPSRAGGGGAARGARGLGRTGGATRGAGGSRTGGRSAGGRGTGAGGAGGRGAGGRGGGGRPAGGSRPRRGGRG
jgi:23S rRNA pseudouridine2605 synthase